MAVSNSIDFRLSATDLIVSARELLGIHAEEESLSAPELTRGIRWLNIMLKAWQADGVQVWTLTEGTLTLVQGQVSYGFGAGGDFTTVPMDIEEMRITRNGNELPMTQLSRTDYYALPNKTTEGYPTQWFYDRQRDSGTLKVWPAPDSALGTLGFTYRRRIMDIDAGANDFDLPVEWHNALAHNLARTLIPIYGKAGTPRAQHVTVEAERLYQQMKAFDTGEGEASVYMLPDDDYGYR